MAQKIPRTTRTRRTPSNRERSTFPILIVLVMGVIVSGMFFYTGLLVVGSVIFVGFFGWLWWTRYQAASAAAAARQRKPAKRRRLRNKH
jgi:hypothetical protein